MAQVAKRRERISGGNNNGNGPGKSSGVLKTKIIFPKKNMDDGHHVRREFHPNAKYLAQMAAQSDAKEEAIEAQVKPIELQRSRVKAHTKKHVSNRRAVRLATKAMFVPQPTKKENNLAKKLVDSYNVSSSIFKAVIVLILLGAIGTFGTGSIGLLGSSKVLIIASFLFILLVAVIIATFLIRLSIKRQAVAGLVKRDLLSTNLFRLSHPDDNLTRLIAHIDDYNYSIVVKNSDVDWIELDTIDEPILCLDFFQLDSNYQPESGLMLFLREYVKERNRILIKQGQVIPFIGISN